MKNKNTWRTLFDIRNEGTRKVFVIFGIKIKIRTKYLVLKQHIQRLESELHTMRKQLESELHTMRKIARLYKLPQINREYIESQVSLYKGMGVNASENRSPRVVVSLTSYPARMYDIHYCLYSLLTQSFKPDAVILWLAKEQFPNGEDDIPEKVLRLRRNGLTIKWCEDLRSYKKLIPALLEYPEDLIVTADDDLYYSPDWLEKLWQAYQQTDGRKLVAHRSHQLLMLNNKITPYSQWPKCIQNAQSSFFNFCTTGGGILYPPHTLHEDVTNVALAKKLCPHADDVWFWGMAVRNGTSISIVPEPYTLIYTNPARELNLNDDGTLFSSNGAGGNDSQIAALMEAYPDIQQKLHKELSDKVCVSVIMPIYNMEKYLSRALDSLTQQTEKRIEIICVNDGSTDSSENILKEYSARDSRIRLISQKNSGQGAARNRAIETAVGDYIAFVDPDDVVSDNFISELYQTALKYNADIAATDQVYMCHDDGRRILKKTGIFPNQRIVRSLEEKGEIIKSSGIVWNKIYRTSLIKKNGIRFADTRSVGEDNVFNILSLFLAREVAICHTAYYNYYVRLNSSVHSLKTKKDFQIVSLYNNIEKAIFNLPFTDTDKQVCLSIVFQRKKLDYGYTARDMSPELRDNFLALTEADLALGIKSTKKE